MSLLTPREREVLSLIACGHSYAEIGRQMFVGRTTVHMLASHAYQKLGARNAAHAVALGLLGGHITSIPAGCRPGGDPT